MTRRGSSRRPPWRIVIGLAGLIGTVLLIAGAVSVRADASVHLSADEATDAMWIRVRAPRSDGASFSNTSARRLDVLGGDSGAVVSVPLGPATCAELEQHLNGSCAEGFLTGLPVTFAWSEPVGIRTHADQQGDMSVRVMPSVTGGRFAICAASVQRMPMTINVARTASGTLTVSDGDTVWVSEPVAADWPLVTIRSSGVRVEGCPLTDVGIPDFFIDGWGYPSAAYLTGEVVDVQGIKSELQLDRSRWSLGTWSVLRLESAAQFKTLVSFRENEDPPLAFDPDALKASRVVVDGVDLTPSYSDENPIVLPLLSVLVGLLIAALTVPALPGFGRPASRR